MHIGIPTEIKIHEGRVALIPDAVAELVADGHTVSVQAGAGAGSGYRDEDYTAAGARIVADAEALYADAQLIVKVKEPQAEELARLRPDHLLFSYLHLAAAPELLQALRDIGLTAVAFETVTDADGRLPLLAPMSDIAGRLAVMTGSNLLYRHAGGRGLLLGGLPGAARGHVVVLGAGTAGGNATRMAAALGATVTVFERRRARQEVMRALGPNVTALHPYPRAIAEAVAAADLLVGAVLITGQRAPHLVSAEMVAGMQPGSVIVDISVDQGGCIATTRPTTWAEPTFVHAGVLHYGVTNMPGAVPRSASQALSAALTPWVKRLTRENWDAAPDLAAGINVKGGKIIHPALRQMAG
ncbi:MAG TPA: alanine dehydrogenase [Gammaproteobacteria bacterium]|nr:alanine dehydrogenase [Gammaproteobacteria bacterium]